MAKQTEKVSKLMHIELIHKVRQSPPTIIRENVISGLFDIDPCVRTDAVRSVDLNLDQLEDYKE